ncbi:MAG: YitT family protein [Paracholeplasma sp.]|nr:YitT family protein [Paracholeplasma sp.]MDY3196408.1 YitT family protein [Paracholeplasma sp.]
MKNEKLLIELRALLAVTIFTIVYGIGVSWFLEASIEPLYTGGIPGLAQLARNIINQHFDMNLGNFFLGAFVFLGNIPIMVIGWYGVSKRFTIYSLISVVIQATILGFIPVFDVGIDDTFVLAVMGGLLTGVGVGGALKYGTSTGGLDIIAQYFSLKNGTSVGFISMILNVFIALMGGLVFGSASVAAYTIIRIIVATIVTDKIHTAYHFLQVEIITQHPQDIYKGILEKVYRGVTLIKVEGAYSHTERTMMIVVISSYELTQIKNLVRAIDSHAFIITQPVKTIYGNFARKTIV